MGSVCRLPREVLALGGGRGGREREKKKRDFIEHINLNLVTANSCLIKGVHITHVNFFSRSPPAHFPVHPISWQRRLRGAGLAAGCAGGDVYFSVIVGSLPWIILLLQI